MNLYTSTDCLFISFFSYNRCWITNHYIHYTVNIGYYALVFIFTTGIFIMIVTKVVQARNIMSRNNLHHQLNQSPTPAHNHQSTNHEHLQSLTTTILKLTHLSHSSAGLKVAWLTTLVDVRLSARPSWN